MVTLKIKDGDYVRSDTGLVKRLSGSQALVQRVLFRLGVRQGAFPLLPEMGSQVYRLMREKPSQRQLLAKKYVMEALEAEPVSVQSVELISTEKGRTALRVYLESQGESFVVETGLE